MRAVMVSVEYTDLLEVTLPYNRHHFREVYIITTTKDAENVLPIADRNQARVIVTDAFYHNNAKFNKWLALENSLDHIGRDGWLCLMDADVLWPKAASLTRILRPGYLYSPLRRMAPWPLKPIPPEDTWKQYPIHRNIGEWAGYTQVFHGSDKHLGPPPWHQTDWIHAGGADSFFQSKWKPEFKVRPAWHVLHLGPAGTNWCGRASTLGDGTEPDQARLKKDLVQSFLSERRNKTGPDRFKHEKY